MCVGGTVPESKLFNDITAAVLLFDISQDVVDALELQLLDNKQVSNVGGGDKLLAARNKELVRASKASISVFEV